MNLLDEVTAKGLAVVVSEARLEAKEDALRDYPVVRSRGTFLATCRKNMDQCEPYPEAECNKWNGTVKQVESAIAWILQKYPDVHQVYIAGGYDGAENVYEMNNDGYEPWVSAWKVVIWTRENTLDK